MPKGIKGIPKGHKFSKETLAKMRAAKLGKPAAPHQAICKCFRCELKLKVLNHNYVDGQWIDLENLRYEMRKEIAIWRRDIFMRDNFACCMCHSVGGRLNAHHIKKFSDYPQLRLDINNGITLCVTCHRSVANKEQEYEKLFYQLLNSPALSAGHTQ